MPVCSFLTLDDDKIVEVWTVFDALALSVQTGAVGPETGPERGETIEGEGRTDLRHA